MLLVAALTAAAIWLVPTSKDPVVVDLPPAPGHAVDVAPDAPDATDSTDSSAAKPPIPVAGPAGSTARQLIAAQRSAGKPDPQAAFERARQLARAGLAEDAYLLDFYAARLGHAEAAFALAEQADPAHWRRGGPLPTAAPEQALKWYRAAADAGHPKATERLTALRRWAETAAKGGDPEAQRLMLAWQ